MAIRLAKTKAAHTAQIKGSTLNAKQKNISKFLLIVMTIREKCGWEIQYNELLNYKIMEVSNATLGKIKVTQLCFFST